MSEIEARLAGRPCATALTLPDSAIAARAGTGYAPCAATSLAGSRTDRLPTHLGPLVVIAALPLLFVGLIEESAKLVVPLLVLLVSRYRGAAAGVEGEELVAHAGGDGDNRQRLRGGRQIGRGGRPARSGEDG